MYNDHDAEPSVRTRAYYGPDSMAQQSEGSLLTPTQGSWIAFALHWWWLILIGTILGGSLAFAYLKFGPVPYESRALVQVSLPDETDPSERPSNIREAAANYAAAAASSHVFELVSAALMDDGLRLSSSQLIEMEQQGALTIKPVTNSNFVSITASDPDPKRASLIADTFASVFAKDVNERANKQLGERKKQLDHQIDFALQRLVTARLRDREQELKQELTAQKTLLLQNQTSFQAELQRQAQSTVLGVPSGAQKPVDARGENGSDDQSPAKTALAQVNTQWLNTVRRQIQESEKSISTLNADLAKVRSELAQLPSNTDPAVSAAFAEAYSIQLENLSQSRVQLELQSQSVTTPVVQYGRASTPLKASSGKKTMLMGLVGGVALALGPAYLFDVLLRWRRKRKPAENDDESSANIDIDDLIQRLDRVGLLETGAR